MTIGFNLQLTETPISACLGQRNGVSYAGVRLGDATLVPGLCVFNEAGLGSPFRYHHAHSHIELLKFQRKSSWIEGHNASFEGRGGSS